MRSDGRTWPALSCAVTPGPVRPAHGALPGTPADPGCLPPSSNRHDVPRTTFVPPLEGKQDHLPHTSCTPGSVLADEIRALSPEPDQQSGPTVDWSKLRGVKLIARALESPFVE